jgi:hypothetical protein
MFVLALKADIKNSDTAKALQKHVEEFIDQLRFEDRRLRAHLDVEFDSALQYEDTRCTACTNNEHFWHPYTIESQSCTCSICTPLFPNALKGKRTMNWKTFTVGIIAGAAIGSGLVGIGIVSMLKNGLLEIKGE